MCWEFKKKHIVYISMMGHLCIDMKVSSLHILMKKQWLIAPNSTLFCCDWICTWTTFESTFLVSIMLKHQIIFSFWFCPSYFLWNFCVIILCFAPSMKIITNCLMSNFLISLFFSFVLIIMCWEFYEVVNIKKDIQSIFQWWAISPQIWKYPLFII